MSEQVRPVRVREVPGDLRWGTVTTTGHLRSRLLWWTHFVHDLVVTIVPVTIERIIHHPRAKNLITVTHLSVAVHASWVGGSCAGTYVRVDIGTSSEALIHICKRLMVRIDPVEYVLLNQLRETSFGSKLRRGRIELVR
ncbi:hypothetical protein [Tsukamurella spumae]|uniref:Uncharacterized protein n=1 Tax=Tsukamurella spumae TaxID=44753 RepID=A0A846X3W0_9ACTN|nr:hypothetical protein [Tsukamurella spumae]NKY18882.1 hypothetical protein [Tsukamurella spumae]